MTTTIYTVNKGEIEQRVEQFFAGVTLGPCIESYLSGAGNLTPRDVCDGRQINWDVARRKVQYYNGEEEGNGKERILEIFRMPCLYDSNQVRGKIVKITPPEYMCPISLTLPVPGIGRYLQVEDQNPDSKILFDALCDGDLSLEQVKMALVKGITTHYQNGNERWQRALEVYKKEKPREEEEEKRKAAARSKWLY